MNVLLSNTTPAPPAPPSGRATPIQQGDPATTPRILCLHGGGTSATIFQIQTIRFARLLCPTFRLEFLDGPFVSVAGPGVHPFFEGMHPYFRWARKTAHDDGDELLKRLRAKLAEPGGPWVGLIGFSQGSAMSMGLLWEQERAQRKARGEPDWIKPGEEPPCGLTVNNNNDDQYGRLLNTTLLPGGGPTDFQFGIICHGSYPPIALSHGTTVHQEALETPFDERLAGTVSTPTVHVHGLKDFVLPRSRTLVKICKEGTATVLPYDIEHRLPVDMEHNRQIADAVFRIWDKVKDKYEPEIAKVDWAWLRAQRDE